MQNDSAKERGSDLRNTTDFYLWMYCVLQVEADKFATAFAMDQKLRFEFKMRFNHALQANKALINYIKESNLIDLLEDQGEWFSKALEVIYKAPTLEDKRQLLELLVEFGEGRVGRSDDYMDRKDVIELVKRFTTVPEDMIQRAYDGMKQEVGV